ncbi:MAG: T9SS type A sorting domain-containing protein, partial [Ignavibacteria bacterium]
TDTDVLFTDQLAIVKAFSIATVDITYGTPMPSWRQPSNPEAANYIYADWPVPIDLSYSDADLMTAGLGGFPLGDLAWFPSKYTEWMAQRDAEYAQIQTVLEIGVSVRELPGIASTYQLSQNYPNPFNPSTVINFTIPQSGNVTLKVYNSVGQEVATLLNEYKNASNYSVDFNAANLSSGVYFYTLKANNFTQTRKMLLLK